MRELKFRAWHKWDKTMIQPNDGDFIGWHAMSNWRDCLEVMQYTGFKDKNGRKIYEGDILNHRCDKRAKDGGWICGTIDYHPENAILVTFEDGQFLLDNKPIKEELWYFNRKYGSAVIGNIYENPELCTKP